MRMESSAFATIERTVLRRVDQLSLAPPLVLTTIPIPAAVGFGGVLLQETFDKPRSFETIERLDWLLEELFRFLLHNVFVQMVFIHQLQNECLLLVRARPLVTVGSGL